MPHYYDMMQAWLASQPEEEADVEAGAGGDTQVPAIADLDLEFEASQSQQSGGGMSGMSRLSEVTPGNLPAGAIGGAHDQAQQHQHTPTSVGSPAASVASGRRPNHRSAPYEF